MSLLLTGFCANRCETALKDSLGAGIQKPSLAHFYDTDRIITHQVPLFGADSRPEVALVLELKEQKTPL